MEQPGPELDVGATGSSFTHCVMVLVPIVQLLSLITFYMMCLPDLIISLINYKSVHSLLVLIVVKQYTRCMVAFTAKPKRI